MIRLVRQGVKTVAILGLWLGLSATAWAAKSGVYGGCAYGKGCSGNTATSTSTYALLIASVLANLIAILILFLLWLARRKRRQQNAVNTNQTFTPGGPSA